MAGEEKGIEKRQDDFSLTEMQGNSVMVAEAAREQYEIQSMFTVAKRFPRDVDKAFAELMASAKRPTFAEEAAYSFPRGDKTVTGPSINIAREAKRVWGNMRAGVRVMHDDAKSRRIRAEAWDLEKGGYEFAEDEFLKLIQRKVKQPDGTFVTLWVVPDERDLRELTNRRAAILVRNCILALLPKDLIEDAMMICADTKKDKAAKDPEGARKRLIVNFMEFRVTPEMIAEKLGHPMAEASPEELVELSGVYQSIKDGQSTWREYVNRDDEATVGSGDAKKPVAAAATQQEKGAAIRQQIKTPPKAQVPTPPVPPAAVSAPAPSEPAKTEPAKEDEKTDKPAPAIPAKTAKDNPTDGELLVPMRLIQQMENGQSIIRKLVLKYAAATPDGAEWPADPEVRLAYLDELWKATNETKKPIFQPVKPVAKPAESQPVATSPSVSAPPEPPVPSDQMLQFDVHVKAIKEALDFEAVMKARIVAGETKSYSMLQQDELDRAMNERLGELRKAKAVKKA